MTFYQQSERKDWESDLVENRMALPLLLSPSQLSQLSGKRGTMIIDTRSFKDYRSRHIRGAVNLSLAEYHWADTSPEGIKGITHHMDEEICTLLTWVRSWAWF